MGMYWFDEVALKDIDFFNVQVLVVNMLVGGSCLYANGLASFWIGNIAV